MKLKKIWPVGRADALYFALLGIAAALMLLGILLFNIWILASAALPIGCSVFRVCSHRLGARNKENALFCGAVLFCCRKASKVSEVLSYDEDNNFRICPDCGARLSLDSKQDVFYITCHKCGCRFLVDLS